MNSLLTLKQSGTPKETTAVDGERTPDAPHRHGQGQTSREMGLIDNHDEPPPPKVPAPSQFLQRLTPPGSFFSLKTDSTQSPVRPPRAAHTSHTHPVMRRWRARSLCHYRTVIFGWGAAGGEPSDWGQTITENQDDYLSAFDRDTESLPLTQPEKQRRVIKNPDVNYPGLTRIRNLCH